MSMTQPAESPRTLHARDELLDMKECRGVVRVPVATSRYWRTSIRPRSFRSIEAPPSAHRRPSLVRQQSNDLGIPLRLTSASR